MEVVVVPERYIIHNPSCTRWDDDPACACGPIVETDPLVVWGHRLRSEVFSATGLDVLIAGVLLIGLSGDDMMRRRAIDVARKLYGDH